jgi:HEAT repeat protein
MRVLPRFVRATAIEARPARAFAARALRHGDEAAARELGRLGVTGVQPLVDRFHRRRRVVARLLHEALGQLERAGTPAPLRQLRIRETVFARLLHDPRPLVRSVAVRVAGHTGNRIWIPSLMRLLGTERDSFVRNRVVEALGELEAIEALDVLRALAEDRAEPARYHAIAALGGLGDPAWPHLERLALTHPESALRRAAAQTLARVVDHGHWLAFLGRLDAGLPEPTRQTAIEGLGRSAARRAMEPLVRALLGDPAPCVREAAADALAALGEPDAAPALAQSALRDPYWVPVPPGAHGSPNHPEGPDREYPVREAASEALLLVGGMRAWEELTHRRRGAALI